MDEPPALLVDCQSVDLFHRGIMGTPFRSLDSRCNRERPHHPPTASLSVPSWRSYHPSEAIPMSIWFYVVAVLVFIAGCRFGIYLAELPIEPVPDSPHIACTGCAAKEAEIQALIRGMS